MPKTISIIDATGNDGQDLHMAVFASVRMLQQFEAWANEERRKMGISATQTQIAIRQSRELLRDLDDSEKAGQRPKQPIAVFR